MRHTGALMVVVAARHRKSAHRTAMFDLHDLIAAHVTGLDQAKWVVDAERREHANVALRKHGRGSGLADGLGGEGWGLEGRDRLQKGKGNNSDGLHGCDTKPAHVYVQPISGNV